MVLIFISFLCCSAAVTAQQLFHFPSQYNDSTCTGDTAFVSINFINNDNANSLTIDSIQIPNGFVRKDTYPVTIPAADTTLLEFYHPAGSVGTFGDSIKVFSNATNRPEGYGIFTDTQYSIYKNHLTDFLIDAVGKDGFSIIDSS